MTEMETTNPKTRRILLAMLGLAVVAYSVYAIAMNHTEPAFGFGFAMGLGFLAGLLLLMNATGYTGVGK